MRVRALAQEPSGTWRLHRLRPPEVTNELGILPARCRLYEEKHAVAYGVCVSQEPHTPAACFCVASV